MIADDRILCTSCRAYATKPVELRMDDGEIYRARRGDCLAAATRRRRDVSREFGPAHVDLPRRCPHFLPLRDAEDQRTGRERFPVLWVEYEAAMAERDRERRGHAQRGIERAKAAVIDTS